MGFRLEDILEQLFGDEEPPEEPTQSYAWVLTHGLPFSSCSLTSDEWDLVEGLYVGRGNIPGSPHAKCKYLLLGGDVRKAHGAISPFSYVEGYIRVPEMPVPVAHAWLSIRGKVVDLSYRLPVRQRRSKLPEYVCGTIPSRIEYFGSVFSANDVLKHTRDHGLTAILKDPLME